MEAREVRCPACGGIDVKDLGVVPPSKHAAAEGSRAPSVHRFRCECGNTFDRDVSR